MHQADIIAYNVIYRRSFSTADGMLHDRCIVVSSANAMIIFSHAKSCCGFSPVASTYLLMSFWIATIGLCPDYDNI